MTFIPSPEQQAIFDYVLAHKDEPGRKALAVSARAGTGKTTTIVELMKRISGKVHGIYAAFNRDIVKDVQPKINGTGVTAKTFHSMGYGVLAKELGVQRLSPNGNKYRQLATRWAESSAELTEALDDAAARLDEETRDKKRKEMQRDTVKMADELTRMLRVTLTGWTDEAELRRLIHLYNLDQVYDERITDLVVKAVPAIMDVAEKELRSKADLDFTDMIYWPVKWDLNVPTYPWVFIDEAQDLSPMQRAIVLKTRAENSFTLVIGDPRQSVYAFAGADSDSFVRTVAATGADVLPLTVTRRCPALITQHAATLVPDFTHLPDAPQGVVGWLDENRLVGVAEPGDMVLCRVKAPLIGFCLEMIANGKPATILGSEIGKSLIAILEKIENRKGYRFDKLLDALEAYEEEQVKRFQAKNDEQMIAYTRDQCEALRTIIEHADAPNMDTLIFEINRLFSNDTPRGVITFATAHKSKGLEAERVFILKPETMPLSLPDMSAEQVVQEDNLDYVARTRALEKLIYLTNDTFLKRNPFPAPYVTLLDKQPDLLTADIHALPAPDTATTEPPQLPEPAPEPEPEPVGTDALSALRATLDEDTDTGAASKPLPPPPPSPPEREPLKAKRPRIEPSLRPKLKPVQPRRKLIQLIDAMDDDTLIAMRRLIDAALEDRQGEEKELEHA